MRWIYLSPHFDDATYSCGGLVWEQAQSGLTPEIWTVFSGSPDGQAITPFARSLHERWHVPLDQAVELRHIEDQAALQYLGAIGKGLGIPECIYRRLPDGRALVSSEDDLWQEIPCGELRLIDILGDVIALQLSEGDNLVSPLSLGNHVDHRIVRAAAEKAAHQEQGVQLWYYADFPYAMRGNPPGLTPDLSPITFPVSEQALAAWQQAVLAYTTQFSSFWSDSEQMKAEIREFRDKMSGAMLYQALM